MAEIFVINATLKLKTGDGGQAELLVRRFATAVVNENFGEFEIKLQTESGYTIHTITSWEKNNAPTVRS